MVGGRAVERRRAGREGTNSWPRAANWGIGEESQCWVWLSRSLAVVIVDESAEDLTADYLLLRADYWALSRPRLRNCWAVHTPSGPSEMFQKTILRLLISMKNRT